MASRLMRHLRWESSEDTQAEQAVLGFFAPPTEIASYLLHIGAEIEHALAVQYLYAGYSLGVPNLSEDRRALVQKWRTAVLDIAREEMAHLATVQNLLTALGSPLTLERQDFPIPTPLFPFAFTLQKLTKATVGRYVLAESPGRTALDRLGLLEEVDAIQKATSLENPGAVHRVGHLYDMIQGLFDADGPDVRRIVPSCDIHPEALRFQVHPGEWGLGYSDLLIMTAGDRDSATAAITAIAEQGEGSSVCGGAASHFHRFLDIYRAFPEEDDWTPTKNVAVNPTTDPSAPADRQITHPRARLWADLFNLRYRRLLVSLSHSFCLQRPLDGATRTPRGLVISWTFGEMYNLRAIAHLLMDLPLGEKDEGVRAGPPFDMPYTLALPTREGDWWRLHRDLFRSSQGYAALLVQNAEAEGHAFLKALSGADARSLHQLETIIGG